MKVKSPNPNYDGISAGVRFVSGEGETEDEGALAYFKRAGYLLEEAKLDSLSVAELKAHAETVGVDVSGKKTKAELLAVLS
jgi:hypothetical protein